MRIKNLARLPSGQLNGLSKNIFGYIKYFKINICMYIQYEP